MQAKGEKAVAFTMEKYKKIKWLYFLTISSLLVLSILIFSQQAQNSSDETLSKTELFYENQDAFVSLLDKMSVNRSGLGILKSRTTEEYKCWTYEGTHIKQNDILNYNEIVATMESLGVVYLYLDHESLSLELSFGDEAIFYRESIPSDDEFGSWEQLDNNWYYVRFPYI